MKRFLIPLAFGLLASPAFGQSMPNSLNMSCASAQALVNSRGAAVIATGPNIFDRYVSGVRYCDVTQIVRPEWIATADNPKCFVGYKCRDRVPRGGR